MCVSAHSCQKQTQMQTVKSSEYKQVLSTIDLLQCDCLVYIKDSTLLVLYTVQEHQNSALKFEGVSLSNAVSKLLESVLKEKTL